MDTQIKIQTDQQSNRSIGDMSAVKIGRVMQTDNMNPFDASEAVHKVIHAILDDFWLPLPLLQTGTNLGPLPKSMSHFWTKS